jgi:hypothetical protein
MAVFVNGRPFYTPPGTLSYYIERVLQPVELSTKIPVRSHKDTSASLIEERSSPRWAEAVESRLGGRFMAVDRKAGWP